jgi:hypothetical protein
MSDLKERPLYRRILIDAAGFGLMIIAPFLGWLPGPGGIPLFLIGLGLVSLNHEWARKLLKDFDKKRVEYTDKYLMTSPKISLAIDISCIILLCLGAFIVFTQDPLTIRAPGLGLVSITLIVLISNQKRFERLSAWSKKKFKN